MGKYRIDITDQVRKDLLWHRKNGRKSDIKKIEQIFSELHKDPYNGTGKVEVLKYDLKDYLSRRINRKDRIVYRVDDNIVTVYVVSARGHYDIK